MTPRQHFELVAATIAAGICASWPRSAAIRFLDMERVANDAVAGASAISEATDRIIAETKNSLLGKRPD